MKELCLGPLVVFMEILLPKKKSREQQTFREEENEPFAAENACSLFLGGGKMSRVRRLAPETSTC